MFSARNRYDAAMISDDDVRALYAECDRALAAQGLLNAKHPSQAYRGVNGPMNCDRHMVVFKTYKAIPEACFDCYKVVAAPGSVLDLIKLMMVFHGLRLPNDNVRKCMIELRDGVSAPYKGFIYCRGLEEGRAVLDLLGTVVAKAIASDVTVTLKRGCTEFADAYPDYNRFDDAGNPVMDYDPSWREDEAYTDQYLVGDLRAPKPFQPVSEFTVRDAQCMRAWLAFAVGRGDDSVSIVTDRPPPPLVVAKPKPRGKRRRRK